MEEFDRIYREQLLERMFNDVKPAGVATALPERLERFTAYCVKEESLIFGVKMLSHFEALSPFAQSMGTLLWDLCLIDPKQVVHPVAHGEAFAIYRIDVKDFCNIPAVQALGEAMQSEGILSTHLVVSEPNSTLVVFHPKVVG